MKAPGAGLLLLAVAGCLSPIALDRAVLEYDQTVHGIDSKLLLLNIARASQGLPVHFTTVSSIAASFDFRASSGITGNVAKDPGEPVLSVSLTAEVAESPTISILPVQGEEFTRRLLTPFEETTFSFLVHQGVDVSLLVRLIGTAIVVEDGGGRRFRRNDPSREDEYREFRRRVLHLQALHEAGVLDVGALTYEERLDSRPGASPGAADLALLSEKGYRVEKRDDGVALIRPVNGRLLVANYNPASLPNEERVQLERRAEEYPRNFVLVDVRPGHPGGDYPFRGWIKLRSFHAVLEFVASGIETAPEIAVEKAPETGKIAENPVKTLEISVSGDGEEQPLSATLGGRTYALGPGRWNRRGFQILYHLYQMTVTGPKPAGDLPVTIAK